MPQRVCVHACLSAYVYVCTYVRTYVRTYDCVGEACLRTSEVGVVFWSLKLFACRIIYANS